MRRFWKNQKGLTMMEVLVTVALLAIVIVPCLSSFVMAQRGNVLADEVYDEYTTAANIMETLKQEQNTDDVVARILDSVAPIETPGVYILYRVSDDNRYTEIWICKDKDGEEPNIVYDPENIDQHEIILKGVIAP